jgi:hypothetical protein
MELTTIQIDASRGLKLDLASYSNDVEIYPIPLLHAIDFTIGSISQPVSQHGLTQHVFSTEATQTDGVRHPYLGNVRNALAIAYFLIQIGIVYQ